VSATEPKPLRADARRNRERIVAAAAALFAEGGQTTQMDDVARRAGVGVGTVYRHFPTKDALAGELLRTKFQRHTETARRWAERDGGWEGFEGFLREVFAEMAADATLQRMMWVTDERALQYAEDARLELAAVVQALIDGAKAEGRLRADFDGDDMPVLMCAVGGVMSARNQRVRRYDHVVEILIDGLRAR
jgi:AcrR family transcriptional regulator